MGGDAYIGMDIDARYACTAGTGNNVRLFPVEIGRRASRRSRSPQWILDGDADTIVPPRCFRHQLLLCRQRHPRRIDHDQDVDCPNLTFSDNQRSIVVGKISLNVSRRVVNPACIAGVLT